MSCRTGRAFAAALGLVCLVGATPLLAQDSATAAALFDKGLSEMQAGRFDAACPALAESYRLDPQPGALFTLAECLAKGGKVASASARYDEYLELYARMTVAQQVGQRGRDKIANQQKQALQPRIPLLTLTLPKDAPAGTRVKRDGILLNEPAIGTPLPVDPGEHVIATTVPGGPEHVQKLTIAEAEKREVTLEIELPPATPVASTEPPTGPAASAAAVPTSTASATPAVAPPHDTHGASVQPSSGAGRTWGWVSLGVGVAGLAVGSVGGVLALQKKSDVDDECKDTACSRDGMSAVNSGRDMALASTIGFGVGAVGLVTGIVLLATSGSGSKESKSGKAGWHPVATTTGTRDAMIGVRGTW
ncbi:MAG TPA: hypothetical protein PLI95_11240 [Polyangiaceae bacterium]|nr:hypothetical protein [Polyangiaceae bacterium]